jgi:hypothetical protein
MTADSSECQAIFEPVDRPVQADTQVACPSTHCFCPKRLSVGRFGGTLIYSILVPRLREFLRHLEENEKGDLN